jgi:hypothetical protein
MIAGITAASERNYPMCFKRVVSFVITLLVSTGMSCGGTMDQAVTDTVKNQPDVKAFVHLFPDAENFITHYTGTAGPRVWNSRVLLYERYILTMQFDMDLDADGVKVTATAPPKYLLQEVTSVEIAPSGQVSINYGDTVRFGPKEWKKLEAAKGDLSVLGIKPKKNQPVPNLKANWEGA